MILTGNAVGFNIWHSVYSGTVTFLEDKGLPMFTTYVYRIAAYNDVGQLTSNVSSEVTTFGGFPRKAANVSVTPIDHLSIFVEWVVPSKFKMFLLKVEYVSLCP